MLSALKHQELIYQSNGLETSVFPSQELLVLRFFGSEVGRKLLLGNNKRHLYI